MIKRALYIFCLISPTILLAGETGKITGRITDSQTGNPLIGVNILFQGMNIGTSTDELGDYILINIPAARYTITASYIGYKSINMTDVVINADRTTVVDFQMEISAVEGQEIVVHAERPVIVKDQTASTITLDEQAFSDMPVNTFEDALVTMAGVVQNENSNSGIHFRGGRSGEITYMVDGFVVEDALYGGMGLDISRDAISELSVITGAFNAEYGEATSGVINIVTKEGDANYHFKIRGVTDNLVNSTTTDRDLTRREISVSGPLLPFAKNLGNFFMSFDRMNTKTSLWKNTLPSNVWKDVNDDEIMGNWVDLNEDGIEDVNEVDTLAWADIDLDGFAEPLKKGAIETTGTFRNQDRFSGKIVLKPISNLKITAGLNSFVSKSRGFSMSYRQVAERYSTNWGATQDFHVKATYTLSKNMFASLRFQDFKTESWTGYSPLLKGDHNLESSLIPIPAAWDGYVPDAITPGDDWLWLGYYAEPYADLNGDGVWSRYSAEYWDDVNGNGYWDGDETFSDWNEDGIWDVYNWTDSNNDGEWSIGEAILPDEFWDVQTGGVSTDPDNYSWGVDPQLREGDAYDNTSNYEFYGRYNIYNAYGDSIREGISTYQNFQWYKSNYKTRGGDLTWQVNKMHQVKAGFESREYDVAEFYGSGIGGGYFGNSSNPSIIIYNHKPSSMNAYIQDKIEYKDLVINVGLRLDKLNPNSTYPDPNRNLGYYYTDNGQEVWIDNISSAGANLDDLEWGYLHTDADGNLIYDNNGNLSGDHAPAADVKSQLSPRLGIGYPISDKIAFHFSYGHFYQFPNLDYMFNYGNYNGDSMIPPGWSDGANAQAQNLNFYGNSLYPFPYNISDWYIPTVGSPNVKPQRSVQYEFGLRSYIGMKYVLSTTVYYKDMFDYASSQIYDADPTQFAIYENIDYANSRGFEIALNKVFRNNYSWYMNYTLSRAEGNAPNSSYHWDVAYLSSVYGWRDYNRTFTMSWDQTHSMNMGFDYKHPKGIGINIIGNMGSGLPYTPTDSRGRPIDEPYSGRMPATSKFDMKAYYDQTMGKYKVRFFADVTNLFDKQNVLNVFSNSGQPDVSLNPNTSPMWAWRPYFFGAPRHIEIGFTVGL
jgi:outer membrane receptor protein involved in Fe transport